MVRRVHRVLFILLVALLLVPPSLAADGETAPETRRPADHPLFAQLPAVPDATRLWAQLSSEGDAFLTLQKDVLPLPYTPPTTTQQGPALVFEAFRHITTSADARQIQYGSRPATAAWDAPLHQDQPIVAKWILSTGARGLDAGATLPPLLVKTTVKAVDAEGFDHLLATRTVRATPSANADAPTPVHVELQHLQRPIPNGTRLVVELDWSWMHVPAAGTARQPFVTVHPGSFVDLPLESPVRIEDLRERTVAGQLYVEAKVAHLFAVENLALQNTNLLVTGPHLQAQGGRAYVSAPRDGPDAGHVATFDWRLPVSLDHLSAGTYDLHVTAGQVTEPGPRVVASRSIEIGPTESTATTAATEATAWPPVMTIAFLVFATMTRTRRRS